jgi:hypothetical protein
MVFGLIFSIFAETNLIKKRINTFPNHRSHHLLGYQMLILSKLRLESHTAI